MGALYLRHVPDEVLDRLQRLAARDGVSVEALAVRELADVSRRVDHVSVLGVLPDLDVAPADLLNDLDEARSHR